MSRFFGALLCGVSIFTVGAFFISKGSGVSIEAIAAAQRPDIIPVPNRGFAVEVLAGGVPLEKYTAHGRLYVEAIKGAEYELRISNPLPVRVAVALSVDGLNTIDARRTSARDATKWVIMPYQTITISGWQMSSSRARRFYFTTERDSYAAKLGRPSDAGVISAVFFRERQPVPIPIVPPYPRPLENEQMERKSKDGARDEARSSSQGESAGQPGARGRVLSPLPDDDYAATGIGRNVHHDVQWVNMNYDPHPVAEVTIRYEYRPALIRLGILPRPYPEPDPLRRRERARGFEDRGFSPEP